MKQTCGVCGGTGKCPECFGRAVDDDGEDCQVCSGDGFCYQCEGNGILESEGPPEVPFSDDEGGQGE